MSQEAFMRKKYRYWIIHIDIMLNLLIIAAILYLNLPYIAREISTGFVLLLFLYYPFVAFRKNSRVNLWLDGILHKINMRSLAWFKKRKERRPIKTE